LQIASEGNAQWMWGDSGSGHIARSRDVPSRWALDFQFYEQLVRDDPTYLVDFI